MGTFFEVDMSKSTRRCLVDLHIEHTQSSVSEKARKCYMVVSGVMLLRRSVPRIQGKFLAMPSLLGGPKAARRLSAVTSGPSADFNAIDL